MGWTRLGGDGPRPSVCVWPDGWGRDFSVVPLQSPLHSSCLSPSFLNSLVMVAVVLSVEGPLGATLMQKPPPWADWGRGRHVLPTSHMRGLSLREGGVPPRVTRLEGSGRGPAQGSPVGVGGPALGALPNLCGPGPSLPSWFQASTYCVSAARSPFLGLRPLAAEIRLAPHWQRSLWLERSPEPTTPPTRNGPRQVPGRAAPTMSFVTFQTVVRPQSTI